MGQWLTEAKRKEKGGWGLQGSKLAHSSMELREKMLYLPLYSKDVMSGKAAAILKKHKHCFWMGDLCTWFNISKVQDRIQWKASQPSSLFLSTHHPISLSSDNHSYLSFQSCSVHVQAYTCKCISYPRPRCSPLCSLFCTCLVFT